MMKIFDCAVFRGVKTQFYTIIGSRNVGRGEVELRVSDWELWVWVGGGRMKKNPRRAWGQPGSFWEEFGGDFILAN